MRVLIDECVDPRVKLLFSDHEVSTVHERGWDTFEDGPLLAIAQKDFDVLLTIDRGLEFSAETRKGSHRSNRGSRPEEPIGPLPPDPERKCSLRSRRSIPAN
jgi:hypothetical protein